MHFAQTAIEGGHSVLMLDVGHESPPPVAQGATFDELKERLDDPVGYLLGSDFQGVTLPGSGEFYGLPPSKDFVLAPRREYVLKEWGFASLASFGRGGLAEAWTGGVYPWTDAELADFPFGYQDLLPHYEEVARRIGISGAVDDLAPFFPSHADLQSPLRLDVHSERLLATYASRRDSFRAGGCFAGRSRIAVLTAQHEDRGPCTYLGRCLWGCPHAALYTPRVTLERLFARPEFKYVGGSYVSHCVWDGARRVSGVVVVRPDGTEETVAADAVALAAGALSSARIMLESVRRATGEVLNLAGLMDNQQILMPFLNPGMIGKATNERDYQYHQVCLGLSTPDPKHYIHAQLTTLKSAMAHPVIQSLPMDLASGTRVFRLLRSALGVANVNLHDTRRPDCTATLERAERGPWKLVLNYRPAADDAAQISAATRRVRAALRRLGCLVPPGMTHVRPKGASVHYAGLIPMGGAASPLTATAEGKSRDVEGLYFADGVTFPFLPAKNITFTLMANAVRVARAM
ncbi:MAG TPA: GMC oxidoreductase [Gemmatimonadales bacterium]